jgi:hypothetical protein
MKKTYEAPMLVEAGDVVRETLGGSAGIVETNGQLLFKMPLIGGVGYYL